MLKIRIPATTANLGPGFDSLGAALNIYATLTFEDCESPLNIYGCDEAYINADNLIYVAYCKTFEYFGERVKNVKIGIESDIPASRGLGSSAACVVGGVAGALYQMGRELDKKVMLEIATEIEGHPDNVAPAIFGGLTASMQVDRKVFTRLFPVNEAIVFVAFIPFFSLSTSDARRILPKEIKFSEAVFNASRIPLLLKSLEENDGILLRYAIQDALHQPYRKKLIPGYDEIEKICIENEGYGVYLSGAGPTMMCISDKKTSLADVQHLLGDLSQQWIIKALKIDEEGIQILRS
jgi:homoserine kinase